MSLMYIQHCKQRNNSKAKKFRSAFVHLKSEPIKEKEKIFHTENKGFNSRKESIWLHGR